MPDPTDLLKEFQALGGDLGTFRALMDRALRSDLDGATRRHLEQLGTAFDSSLAQLKEQLPAAVQHLAAKEAKAQASIDETMARAEELKRAAAAAPEVPIPRVPKPAAAALPSAEELEARVRKYRRELLGLLGEDEAPVEEERRGGGEREIWQDWSKLEGQ